jgi:hypothetical protein
MQCEEGYMPLYEYEITGTDLRYEVLHSITEHLTTWGELATVVGVPVGTLDMATPVTRLVGGRIFVNGNLTDLSKGKVVQRAPSRRSPSPRASSTG